MGIFSQIKQAIDEAAAREQAEKRAFYQRMQPYKRGYDVYPDEVCEYFVGMLRRSIAKHFIIELGLSLIAMAGIAAGFLTQTIPPIVMLPIPAVFLMCLAMRDASRLKRIKAKKYDAFGAMVTDDRIESHTSTDSDGSTTTTYDYYIWLNGVKCEVTKKEFDKAGLGTYTYFVRLKDRYIKYDLFFLYPTDPSEADHRIGQHYPDDELRLWGPPAPSGAATMLLILGIIAVITGFLAYTLPRTGDKMWLTAAAGGGVMAVTGLIARAVSREKRAREKLIQKVKLLSKKQQKNDHNNM